MAGREAMEAAASKALDHTAHSGRPRLSSMSSMKSIGSESDFKGLEADDKDKALFVPPLPLYALLAADKDTSGSGSATAGMCHCNTLVPYTNGLNQQERQYPGPSCSKPDFS